MGQFGAKQESQPSQRGAGLSPQEITDPRTSGAPAGAGSTRRGTLGGPQPRPGVPRSSLGALPLRGWEICWEVWSTGSLAVVWMAGRATVPRTGAQRHCEPGLISKGWGTSPEGGLSWGCLPWTCSVACVGPKPASCGSDKSHLLGSSPCSSTPQGGPLYRWKKRGIFPVVGSGRRVLLVCFHVGQLLAHPAQVSQPHGVGGPLIAGIRCPAGIKGRRGHSPSER